MPNISMMQSLYFKSYYFH